MKAKAIVFTGPGQVEVRRFNLRKPRPGEVLIESAYTCISPGTELRRLHGKESVGSSGFPLVPGYCLAGRIVECGRGVTLDAGTPVIAIGTLDAGGFPLGEGGHVSHAVTTESHVVPVPKGVDLVSASAAILAGICYHGLKMSRPAVGEKAAVIGLGAIGQLAARVHAAAGAEVVGCDLSPRRAALCRKAGIRAVTSKGAPKTAFSAFFPAGADIIVDSTGVPGVLPQAMALGHRSAWSPLHDMPSVRYLIQGTYEGDFTIPYSAAYAGQFTFMIPSGSQLSDAQAALGLIARKQICVRDVISDVRKPEAAAKTYAELRDPETCLVTVAFRWR